MGYAAAVEVHVYSGGVAWGGGTFITAWPANLPNEPGVTAVSDDSVTVHDLVRVAVLRLASALEIHRAHRAAARLLAARRGDRSLPGQHLRPARVAGSAAAARSIRYLTRPGDAATRRSRPTSSTAPSGGRRSTTRCATATPWT